MLDIVVKFYKMSILYFKKTRVFSILLQWMLLFLLSIPCECNFNNDPNVERNVTVSNNDYEESSWKSLKTKFVNIYRNQDEYLRLVELNPCYDFGCLCVNTSTTIICENSNFDDLLYSNLTKFSPKNIILRHVSIYHLNFTMFFEKFPSVRILSMEHCRIRDFVINEGKFLIRELYMDHNYLSNFDNICLILERFSSLKILSFNFNHFKVINECSNVMYSNLRNLSLTNNEVIF